MAPISSLSSFSTSSSTMNRCQCGASADNLWNFYLPISTRGLFLQDSFFEHAHALFNDAVRQVLGRWSGSDSSLLTDRWSDTNLCLSNNLSRYRQLRAQNLKEENQAVTASDDNASHKIVLDVHDFMDGEVKVKVVGERELVVEGHTKTNTGDHSVSSQSFRRHFTLPDLTNVETITSVMSSDGILTITAPKIVNQENKECLMIPITVEGTTSTNQVENNASSSQTTSNTSTSSANSKMSDTTEECRCKAGRQEYEAVNSSVRQQNLRKVPIKINSTLIGGECASQTSESKQSCIHSEGSKTNSKLGAESETEKLLTKETDDSFLKTTDKKKENLTNFAQLENTSNVSTNARVASGAQHSTTEQVRTNSKLQTQNSSSSKVNMAREIPISNSSFLPITRRGLFSSDSFFEDIRRDFENTVNETLRKWGETGLFADGWGDANLRLSNNLGRYRQLRVHNLREEDQAVTVTSDNTSHKIVLDVHDFMDGEVKVKVVGERELVVEGHTKTNTGDHSVSSQSFRRHFTLPHLTNVETITSVMSSDGILTITASKRQVSQATDEGYIIPIIVDGRSNTDVKCASTPTPQAASGNTASTTNSKLLEAEEKKRTADERQDKMRQQNVTKSTLHEKRTENKTEDKNKWNNVSESQRNFTPQSHEDVTSQENAKKGKTIPIQTETELSEAAEPLATPQETRKQSHQSMTSSSEKSTLTSQSRTSEDKHSATDSSNIHFLNSTILPVTTRGLFFSDSFFRDSWKDFQEAVRDVVSKWGDRSSAADDMTCYRTLRTRDIKEEYQAAKSSEDELNIKIVVDVRNFTNGGEITVKAVKDRELVVEGRVQKEEDGSLFTKRFLRHFILPCDVCLESVTSVLSSDGVLTITAPKKPSNLRIKEVTVPTTVEEGTRKTQSDNLSSDQTLRLNTETLTNGVSPAVPVKTEGSSESSAAAETSVREESSSRHNSSVTSHKVSDVREHVIPLQLDETQESETSAKEDISAKATKRKNSLRKDDFWIKQTVQEENEVKDCTSADKTGVDLDLQEEDSNQVTALGSQSMTNETTGVNTNKQVSCMNQHDQTKLENVSSVFQNKWLPITVRGTFFNDSFFEDSRNNYAAAVRDVLKTNEGSSIFDDITSYRSLRERDLKLENQAVHVEEDQQSLKIVIDVYDFIGGDVEVSVAEGKELVVEGQAKIKEGTTRTFLRRFSLPRFVDLDAITSAMSSDGVLTIISPKLQPQASQTGTSEKEVFTESQARIDTQSDVGRAWAEKCEKKSAKDSEGCSSRTFSSTYRSQQEYSSKKSL